jgi:hypothetical protein
VKHQGKDVVGYNEPAKESTLLDDRDICTGFLDDGVDRSRGKQGALFSGNTCPYLPPPENSDDKLGLFADSFLKTQGRDHRADTLYLPARQRVPRAHPQGKEVPKMFLKHASNTAGESRVDSSPGLEESFG